MGFYLDIAQTNSKAHPMTELYGASQVFLNFICTSFIVVFGLAMLPYIMLRIKRQITRYFLNRS